MIWNFNTNLLSISLWDSWYVWRFDLCSFDLGKFLCSFRIQWELKKIYRSALSPFLSCRNLWFVYLLVGFQLSSVICHLSTDTHRFAFVGFDLLWLQSLGLSKCVRIESWENFGCGDSFWRTSPNVRICMTIFCDSLRLRLTFVTSNFADKILFLEGKNCKTLNSELLILRLNLNLFPSYKYG